MPNPTSAASAAAVDAGNENPIKRWALKKANRELQLLHDRLVRLRARFLDAGAGFEDRVTQLDAVALRLEALQARVLPMGMLLRLTNSSYEESEVQAIAARIDRIVDA